jgi:hypothetical protein
MHQAASIFSPGFYHKPELKTFLFASKYLKGWKIENPKNGPLFPVGSTTIKLKD